MQKIVVAVFALMLFLLIQSCKKNGGHESKQYVIDTALASGIEYRLDLKPYGDADDVATISRQGTNFSTSEIVNATGVFAPVYHYIASAKPGLNDQVILAIKEGTGGNRHHADSTIITINFLLR